MGLGAVVCVLAIVIGTAWAQGKPEDSVVVYSAAADMVNTVAAAEWPTSFRGKWKATFRQFEIAILAIKDGKVTGEYRFAGNPLDPKVFPRGGVRPLEGTISGDKMLLRLNSNVIIAISRKVDGSFELRWEDNHGVSTNYAAIPAPIAP